jgi:hypothetical protein
MNDLYHKIYTSEIFQKSQCIWHENTTLDLFRSMLIARGYSAVDASNKVWKKHNQTVVICLVDDFITCASDLTMPVPDLFDKDTVVITDTYVTCPTRYRVLRLPDSFFGIYWYQPVEMTYNPQRRLNVNVNRIDSKRLLLFLEFHKRSQHYPDPDSLDWLNFNCWSWQGNNDSDPGLQENFEKIWWSLDPQYHEIYGEYFSKLRQNMPLRNYDMTIEQASVSAALNIVIETYSGEATVALSEKIFRALVTPTPWLLYAGKWAVARLKSLGFDALDDVVRHTYDSLSELKTSEFGDKPVEFVFEAANIAHDLGQQPLPKLQQRLQTAAAHNQNRLWELRQQWPGDFAAWFPEFVDAIR